METFILHALPLLSFQLQNQSTSLSDVKVTDDELLCSVQSCLENKNTVTSRDVTLNLTCSYVCVWTVKGDHFYTFFLPRSAYYKKNFVSEFLNSM